MGVAPPKVRVPRAPDCECSFGVGRFCRRCGRPRVDEPATKKTVVGRRPCRLLHKWREFQQKDTRYRYCVWCEMFQQRERHSSYWSQADVAILVGYRAGLEVEIPLPPLPAGMNLLGCNQVAVQEFFQEYDRGDYGMTVLPALWAMLLEERGKAYERNRMSRLPLDHQTTVISPVEHVMA